MLTIQRGMADLDLPCGRSGGSTTVSADWYIPQGVEVGGLVWLQHGFVRGRAHMAGLAGAIAAGSGAAVVAPSVSSNALTPSRCWINGPAMHRAVARLFGDGFGELQASADLAADDACVERIALPHEFVLAGHSAGGNLAVSAAGFTTLLTLDGGDGGAPVVTNLRGVVLLDGVDHRGAIGTGLDRLAGAGDRPVRTVAAPDSSCNANGRGTKVLQRQRPGQFVGVRLVGGSHLDAEGEHPGRFASAACGAPRPENVAAVRYLAAGWISDLLTGQQTPDYLADTRAGTVTMLPCGATATTL